MLRRSEAKQAGGRTSPPPSPNPSRSGPPSSSPLNVVNAYWQGDSVVVLSRGPTGELSRTERPAVYSCFLRDSDLNDDLRTRLKSLRHIKSMTREGSWWRLTWHNWKVLRKACDYEGFFPKLGIPTYEADLNPVRRWLTDTNVTIAKPRRAFVDLETDSRIPILEAIAGKARVLCWALVRADGTRISGVLEEDTDDAERELLKDFWVEATDYDQICSWGEFDRDVLKERTITLGLTVNTKRWLWLDHLALFRRMNMSASESGDEKQSMSLEAVAQALLGEGKAPIAANRSWDYWSAGGKYREALMKYNVRDADLERRIEDASGYIELHQAVCEVCTTLPDTRGANPTNYVEGYLLKLAKEEDVHFKTKYGQAKDAPAWAQPEQFEGAYVMEPTKTGLIEDVHVVDFAALYPSIIITFNLSPETLTTIKLVEENRPSYLAHLPNKPRPCPEGYCVTPHGIVFSTAKQGILPKALITLLRLRAEWTAKKNAEPPGTPAWKDADRRSSAYKIAANSFYGVLGSLFSRFYERDVAESVTLTGQWLIKETIKAAEARGYFGLYGDTDSVFVTNATREAFAEFTKWCNDVLYHKLLDEQNVPREWRTIKLAYEKQFRRLIMVGKKRYAGSFAHYKGKDATADSKPEIKGLEYKRGDSLRLAREFQLQTVNALLFEDRKPEEFIASVQEWRRRMLEGELTIEDVTLSKRMTKMPKEYKTRDKKNGGKTEPPAHVVLAARMMQAGFDIRPGDRVPYIVADASGSPMKVIHPTEFEGKFDRYYLWEQLVYPPTQRVLEAVFPAERWKVHQKVRPSKRRRFSPEDSSLPLFAHVS